MSDGSRLQRTLLHAWLGCMAGLASACVALEPTEPTEPGAIPAPQLAQPQIDALLERVREGRPLLVEHAGNAASKAPRFGWVQPLSHEQLAALRSLGHPPDLVAETFQPSDTPAPDRTGILNWLLAQDPLETSGTPLRSTAEGRERRQLLLYLATPLAPGMTESWNLQSSADRLSLSTQQVARPTISLAQALRRTDGHADPELRALLADAIAAQGLGTQ